ncbi:MAG: hypothetical protein HFH62_13905 [Lachnospiraceae bacterium]|nr:hypothetical protein [Lachnospiraceae bacterium]
MFKYFLIRLIHKKNFYLALLVGIVLSVLYIAYDVYPYRDPQYDHSVYSIWMGGFTGSIYASLYYLLLPLIVAIPMADTWLSDRQSGYFQFVESRNKRKQYFGGLYLSNFLAGGLVSSIPLLVNIYLCFLLIPDKKLDLILWETHTVSMYGGEALFPQLYYDHPLLHVLLTLLLAFVIGGLLASTALAFGCLLKNIFMVWISVFVMNYLYESIIGVVCSNGGGTYQLLTYAHQVAPTGTMELSIIMFLLMLLFVFSIGIVYRGVMRYELD